MLHFRGHLERWCWKKSKTYLLLNFCEMPVNYFSTAKRLAELPHVVGCANGACLGFELTAVLLNKIRVIWKWTRCKCKPHHALRADLQLAQRIIYPNLRAPQWYKHEANVTRSCSNFFSVTQINHNTHENRKKPNHTLKISKGGRRFTSNKKNNTNTIQIFVSQ